MISVTTRQASIDGRLVPAPDATCEQRGFHGPFVADSVGLPGDLAPCSHCGARLPLADHLPAYQIARFHGLVS